MAKEPASEQIMPAAKMKPLLILSKREPVQAAIGLTSDGEGVILLDKKAKPRKVFAMLKADAAKAKLALNTGSLRFGRAEVDPDYDSSMVRFFLNKDAPGAMRAKLVEVVKKMAFQKVELNVDPSLEEESDEGEGEEAPASTSSDSTDASAPPPAPPPPAPTAAQNGPRESDLRMAIGALAKRIPEAAGDDAAKRATLLKVAGLANEQIKGGDLAAAAATIGKLRDALGAAAPKPTGKLVAMRTAMLQWRKAQQALDAEIDAIGAAVLARDDVKSDPRYDAIEVAVDQLPLLLPAFSGALEAALDDGIEAKEPAAQVAAARRAVTAVAQYRQALAGAAAQLAALQKIATSDLGLQAPLHAGLDRTLADLERLLAA